MQLQEPSSGPGLLILKPVCNVCGGDWPVVLQLLEQLVDSVFGRDDFPLVEQLFHSLQLGGRGCPTFFPAGQCVFSSGVFFVFFVRVVFLPVHHVSP